MRCTISQIYFGIELYMFRAGLLSIISILVLYTQHSICHTGYAECLLARSGWNSMNSMLARSGWNSMSSNLISLADSQHNLYDKYLLLCIQY